MDEIRLCFNPRARFQHHPRPLVAHDSQLNKEVVAHAFLAAHELDERITANCHRVIFDCSGFLGSRAYASNAVAWQKITASQDARGPVIVLAPQMAQR